MLEATIFVLMVAAHALPIAASQLITTTSVSVDLSTPSIPSWMMLLFACYVLVKIVTDIWKCWNCFSALVDDGDIPEKMGSVRKVIPEKTERVMQQIEKIVTDIVPSNAADGKMDEDDSCFDIDFYLSHEGKKLHNDRQCRAIKASRRINTFKLCTLCAVCKVK